MYNKCTLLFSETPSYRVSSGQLTKIIKNNTRLLRKDKTNDIKQNFIPSRKILEFHTLHKAHRSTQRHDGVCKLSEYCKKTTLVN